MTEQLKEVYKVRVKKFTDKEDNDRVYKLGEIYPAEGASKPSEKRIAALSSRANKARIQIIEKTTVTVDVEDEGEGGQEVKVLADHNKADLQKLLDEKGVEYNKSDNKDVLIQKLEEAAEQEEEEEDEEDEEE